jgi:flagellar basal-body rod protein FlgB
VESISSVVVLKALDALSMRATVSAHNIANANSSDFRPLKLTFEEALQKAAVGGRREAIEAVRPQVDYAYDEQGGQSFRLDLELATATSTSGRYGTLAELLNRQLQLNALAVSGNR